MEKFYSGNNMYYQFKDFGDEGITHLFTSKIGWDQDRIFQVLEELFGLEEKQVYRGRQVHGNKIFLVDGSQDGTDIRNIGFDGLITREKNKLLVTYHADCNPLYFYDSKNKVIGLAHSGWRGTFSNIAREMVACFTQKFNSNPSDIQVAMGPSICKDCYEIQDDLRQKFLAKYQYPGIISEKEGKIYLDIPSLNKFQLLDAGILEENISMADICTFCQDKELYSYRKSKTRGRMLAAILLKE